MIMRNVCENMKMKKQDKDITYYSIITYSVIAPVYIFVVIVTPKN